MTMWVQLPATHSVQCPCTASWGTEAQGQGRTSEAVTIGGGNFMTRTQVQYPVSHALSISVLPGPPAQETLVPRSSAGTPGLYPPRFVHSRALSIGPRMK